MRKIFYLYFRMLILKPYVEDIWRNEEELKKDMKKANVSRIRDDHWSLAKKFVKTLEPFYEMTTVW